LPELEAALEELGLAACSDVVISHDRRGQNQLIPEGAGEVELKDYWRKLERIATVQAMGVGPAGGSWSRYVGSPHVHGSGASILAVGLHDGGYVAATDGVFAWHQHGAWRVLLRGLTTHGFAFDSDGVVVATSNGLYRGASLGAGVEPVRLAFEYRGRDFGIRGEVSEIDHLAVASATYACGPCCESGVAAVFRICPLPTLALLATLPAGLRFHGGIQALVAHPAGYLFVANETAGVFRLPSEAKEVQPCSSSPLCSL